jgi:uncharacterized protein YlaI
VNKNNNVNCFACNKKQLSKDEIGLNKKMLGRNIKQFYCLDCFADYFDVTTEELFARIEEFKKQGCTLF